jgi:midasin
MTAALESAALALCQGLPLVVEGPAGCGKTSLLRALAAATGNAGSALWLHLDDQQDAKSLLGSYSCSAVPGEFVWQPGPLARAVAEGRWVVIEGVDSAPPDILASLLPLLESGVLHIPSRGQVLTAAPGFKVMGTIITTHSSSSGSSAAAVAAGSSTAQDVLGSLWAKVRLAAPTEAEQLQVLRGLYPDLDPLLPHAQATVHLLHLAGRQATAAAAAGGSSSSSMQQQAAAAALAAAGVRVGELALVLGRHTSTRDLIKWCARMVTCHGHLLARCLKQLDSSSSADHQQQQQQRRGGGSSKKQKRSKASTAADTAATAAAGSSAAARLADLTRVDQALKHAAFVEAADLFAGLVAKPEAKLKLLSSLASLWGCAGPADVALQYEELSKPNMDVGSNELQVGCGCVCLCLPCAFLWQALLFRPDATQPRETRHGCGQQRAAGGFWVCICFLDV